MKSYRDWDNTIDTAKMKAREERSLEIARQMKSKGIPVTTIVECTGLGEDEISWL